MKKDQTELEKRVWQRVKGESPLPQPERELAALLAGEAACWAVCGALSRRTEGKNGSKLRQIAEEAQENLACLKGMYLLTTGHMPVVHPTQPSREPVLPALQGQCRRELQLLQQYTLRAGDPECGPVFAGLAQRKREHCTALLQILGSRKE